MYTLPKESRTDPISHREARVFCYVLGPISGVLMLQLRPWSEIWSVRFHAYHSIVTGAFWGLLWLSLQLAESLSPSWLMGAFMREMQFLTNFCFIIVWGLLMVTAYWGERFVSFPFLHQLAVRLARHSDKRRWKFA